MEFGTCDELETFLSIGSISWLIGFGEFIFWVESGSVSSWMDSDSYEELEILLSFDSESLVSVSESLDLVESSWIMSLK